MDQRDAQALNVVKLYFAEGLSQAEVAAELGISRPTVSKLIQHAKNMGYVTITIDDPRESSSVLAQQLADIFQLEEVRLTAPPVDEEDQVLTGIARSGARLTEELVTDGMSVGISWGNTMFHLARKLEGQDRRDIEIVQLKGGISHSATMTNDVETIHAFCTAFNAHANYLPLPVIFDNVEVKRLVETERQLSSVLAMGRNADIAVFTVGSLDDQSMLMNLGYFSDAEINTVRERGVGDVCSRFYDANGEVCLPSLDERTVGIQLDELRKIPIRVLVAGGNRKTDALEAALKAGFATHLATDSFTAKRLIARNSG